MIKSLEDYVLDVNILLNTTCNLRCPFCFAIDNIEKISGKKKIDDDDFSYVVELLKKDGLPHVNLIGGEPSIHPNVFNFIELLHTNGINVGFSTNAVWKEETIKRMERYKKNIQFEVTLHPAAFYGDERLKQLKDTLDSLKGSEVALGLVIYSLEFDYAFHLELARKLGFEIRWTLAEPAANANNVFMYYENQQELRKIGERIFSFIKKCDDNGIATWLDLEVPACAFSDEQTEFFSKSKRHHIQFECPPFLDIGPDLKVWKCFPLSELHNFGLKETDSIKEAYRGFLQRFKHLKKKGVFDECGACPKSNSCSGGPKILKHMRHGDG
ncbi:radical SAM protein [Candidatus Micrarchaeota archaeon]|nr:radical SAM protein [Candidatus Micrarchaeota archaeon]